MRKRDTELQENMTTEKWFNKLVEEYKDDLYSQICGLEFEINEKRLDNQDTSR